MQLADRGTDNPDQRIAEDLALFCEKTLSLSLGLMSAVITLGSFLVILWRLSGTLTSSCSVARSRSPAIWCGWRCSTRSPARRSRTGSAGRWSGSIFRQQKVEADFRFSLVRFRENAEAVALYRGEHDELRQLRARFAGVATNWWEIMRRDQEAHLVPRRLRADRDHLSVPRRRAAVFLRRDPAGRPHADLHRLRQGAVFARWFVDAYTQIASWKATVDRLTSFHGGDARARRSRATASARAPRAKRLFNRAMRIDLPGGQPLLGAARPRPQRRRTRARHRPVGLRQEHAVSRARRHLAVRRRRVAAAGAARARCSCRKSPISPSARCASS